VVMSTIILLYSHTIILLYSHYAGGVGSPKGAGGKVVMSTKNVLGRPWIEFALGIDQVCVCVCM
jgi:hypothetical protein